MLPRAVAVPNSRPPSDRQLQRQHACDKIVGAGLQFVPSAGDRRKRAAMMNRGAEPAEGGEMLGHAVTHMALEAVTWMRSAETSHQAVAGHFGDNRGRRNGRDETVATDHGLAVAGGLDAVTAVDEDEARLDRQCRN